MITLEDHISNIRKSYNIIALSRNVIYNAYIKTYHFKDLVSITRYELI